jgi:hypothetical protein
MNIYYVAAIWLGMALLASVISIWIAVPAALVEIVIGALAGNIVRTAAGTSRAARLAGRRARRRRRSTRCRSPGLVRPARPKCPHLRSRRRPAAEPGRHQGVGQTAVRKKPEAVENQTGRPAAFGEMYRAPRQGEPGPAASRAGAQSATAVALVVAMSIAVTVAVPVTFRVQLGGGGDDDHAPGWHRPAGLHGQHRSGVLAAGLPADPDVQAELLEPVPDHAERLACQRT